MTTPHHSFRLGDQVRSAEHEGIVVQIGSGYPEIDTGPEYLWIRIADHTERQLFVRDIELVHHGEVG